jgi:hypothetical protein
MLQRVKENYNIEKVEVPEKQGFVEKGWRRDLQKNFSAKFFT